MLIVVDTIKKMTKLMHCLYGFSDVLVQDYGRFKLEPEGGVYGTKKNRYYFDRVQE